MSALNTIQPDGSIKKIGHAVTVESYMFGTPIVTDTGTTSSTNYFFGIFDGWYYFQRWINYYYKNFLYREGVFFNG